MLFASGTMKGFPDNLLFKLANFLKYLLKRCSGKVMLIKMIVATFQILFIYVSIL